MHGNVDRQIIGGLSGGIVVEGSERLYPFLKGLTEWVILFKHRPIGRADYQELVTVNATVMPKIPIRPGEAQFWEMGHIGADRFLRVKVERMPFYVIGRDGYFLPHPIKMDEVLLGPVKNGNPGAAKMIIPFTNPEIVGRFVFHCHVVKHEDKGMMGTIEVHP